MKIKRRYLAIAFVVTAAITPTVAQEAMTSAEAQQTAKPTPEPTKTVRTMSVGPTAAYGVMLNGTSGFTLPEAPTCCSEYTSTTGSGVLFGAEVGFPLSESMDIITSVVYQTSSTTFTSEESVTVRSGNGTTQTQFVHTLATSTGGLFLEPAIDWRVSGNLSILGGLRLGTMLSGTYEQSEAFADNSIPYDFADGRAVRNTTSGDLANTNALQAGLVLGLRYRLPMNSDGTVHLVPSVVFSPMFTDVVSDASWSISPIRLGLSVLFDLTKQEAVASPLKP